MSYLFEVTLMHFYDKYIDPEDDEEEWEDDDWEDDDDDDDDW
jgi:hypothetical protein